MSKAMIHLGYEVGTGEPVSIPLGHLVCLGMTQQAGKTTTLAALIARASVRGLAFITKRGEGGFETGRRIEPYYREGSAGRPYWQFVESIVSTVMGESKKFERAWIVKASRGASSLAGVRKNIPDLMAKAKRDMDRDIFMLLAEYLDIVIPQIQRIPKASRLKLGDGLNVMDLTAFPEEMQMLLVKSAVEWVHENERGVVTIIPEAWKFVPDMAMTPVKPAVERLIREGAGLGNFVWSDSQDAAGLWKLVQRPAKTWLIGVQRERNEVKRNLDNIPGTFAKPNAKDVMTLELGQFYGCFGHSVVKVYVQPAWMDEKTAKDIAMGKASVDDVRRPRQVQSAEKKPEPIKTQPKPETENDMGEERLGKLETMMERLIELQTPKPAARAPSQAVTSSSSGTTTVFPFDEEDLYRRFRARLMNDMPSTSGGPITVTPPEKLRKDFQREEVDRIVGASRELTPLAKRVLKLLETTDEHVGQKTIADRLGRSNSGNAAATLSKAIKDLADIGFVEIKNKVGVHTTLRGKIVDDLTFYKPTDGEVEAVYQTVLYEVATGESAEG